MSLRERIESLVAEQDLTPRRDEARAAFADLRQALSDGSVRAAEPDASTPTGWRVNTWVKQGILLGFRSGGLVDVSADHGRWPFFDKDTLPLQSSPSPTTSASCPADRRSATAPTSRPASSACRRCTSTSAPTSARAR